MRTFVCTLLLLSGCAVSPVRLYGPATIEFQNASNERYPGYIASVNGQRVPKGPLHVAPGIRKIEYQCPNQVTVDVLPYVMATLEAGKSYQLYCVDGKALVRLQQSPGA